MEQFSLDKWLENPQRKVVTRDGREVDLFYSSTSRIPLIGRISDNEIHQYTKDGFQYEMMNQAKNDLFFADEEETLSTLLTELKSYLANTPREQIEKYWKEIQDWYNQHVANKSNEENELTEFDEKIKKIMNFLGNEVEEINFTDAGVKELSSRILDFARKEILKDLPKWIPSWRFFNKPTLNDKYLHVDRYFIDISELFEKLPKAVEDYTITKE